MAKTLVFRRPRELWLQELLDFSGCCKSWTRGENCLCPDEGSQTKNHRGSLAASKHPTRWALISESSITTLFFLPSISCFSSLGGRVISVAFLPYVRGYALGSGSLFQNMGQGGMTACKTIQLARTKYLWLSGCIKTLPWQTLGAKTQQGDTYVLCALQNQCYSACHTLPSWKNIKCP